MDNRLTSISPKNGEVRPFRANRIALIIYEIAQGESARALQKELRKAIEEALGASSTKVTRLLNNTDQPTSPELAVIAQVLSVSASDLIQLEEAAK